MHCGGLRISIQGPVSAGVFLQKVLALGERPARPASPSASDISFDLVSAGLRHPSPTALKGFWTQQPSCQDLRCQVRRESSQRGKQGSGLRRCLWAACVLQIIRLSWTCGLDSTLWSRPLELSPQPFAGPQGPIGRSLEISPRPAASHTGSLLSWSPRSTLQGISEYQTRP